MTGCKYRVFRNWSASVHLIDAIAIVSSKFVVYVPVSRTIFTGICFAPRNFSSTGSSCQGFSWIYLGLCQKTVSFSITYDLHEVYSRIHNETSSNLCPSSC